MPERLEPFIEGEIYHIFNQTIDGKRIFIINENCRLFFELIKYYRSTKAQVSFSLLSRLTEEAKQLILKEIAYQKYFQIEILAYCLMPTHFHLLLRQMTKAGIPKFISNLVNAFTRNLNIKNRRKGPIFIPKFKSERIVSEEQLKHVSRYIHLNPYSSGIARTLEDLEKYPLSSYQSYIRSIKNQLLNYDQVLSLFNFDKERYKNFVLSNAEHQRTLEIIKYADKW